VVTRGLFPGGGGGEKGRGGRGKKGFKKIKKNTQTKIPGKNF